MNKIRFSVCTNDIDAGMFGVYIRCEQFGKSILIDTGVHVFFDEWDSYNGKIIRNPNAKRLNLLIRKTLYQLEEYELDYDGEFTLSKLKEIWDGRESSHDFYSMMDYQIEHRDIREGTKGIHRRVLKHLRKFCESCSVSDLTEDFARGFIRYMREVGLNQTTIGMQIHVLRCYYNIARKLFGSKVPSGSFDFYHEKLSDRLQYKMKSFTDDDIRKIENYIARTDTPARYVETLDRFLFMAYTGVRISDFASFTDKNFTIENGKMWLSYTSIKTSTDVRIPISSIFDGRAEQIINKYLLRLDTFFGIRKELFNAKLKIAVKHAGIDKRVSAHVARHTCASRLVNKDVPVTTIQKVIGHRSLKMTMVYAQTNENTLVRQLS
jgi:integrase